MRKAAAHTDAEAQKANLNSFNKWIKENKKIIKASPNKSIVYSGGSYDIDIKHFEKSDHKEIENTKMWKVISAVEKRRIEAKTPSEFETVEAVLRKIRSHPRFIDRDDNDKDFAHMYEYMECLKDFPQLFPKTEIENAWRKISETYAENAEGDIAFLDGVTRDFKILESDAIFVENELAKLASNKKISDHSKKVLKEKIGKYLKYISHENKKIVKEILNEKNTLKHR